MGYEDGKSHLPLQHGYSADSPSTSNGPGCSSGWLRDGVVHRLTAESGISLQAAVKPVVTDLHAL